MELLSTIGSFLLVIGILVFVHELGHFLAAKWTGMRADVFALGMGPRLFGWNKHTGFTFGKLPADLDLGPDTDYRICAFPVGGYVKILGMIDESFDTEFVGKEAQPWEFRSKKNWQKAIVLVAGVVMNILLAIAVFWALPLAFGREDMGTTTVGWVEPGTVAFSSGLERGDRILEIDGKPMTVWSDVTQALSLDDQTGSRRIAIKRNNETLTKSMSSRDIVRGLASGSGIGLYPDGWRVNIDAVVSYKPADKAGMKPGDIILAVDSTAISAVPQLQRVLRLRAGKPVTVHIERGDTTMPLNMVVAEDSTIGVQIGQQYVGERVTTSYGVLESLTMAVDEVWRTVGLIGASVMHVIRGDVAIRQSFGGPIQIAKMASRSQDAGAEPFLRFMALISISLAVMNLLPLPGLDGGHLVFVGIEAVIRRELPTNFKIRVQQIGFVLLLLLMAFVFYLDLTR